MFTAIILRCRWARVFLHLLLVVERKESWARARAGIKREFP